MLKFKIEMDYWPVIKTCLLYLGYVEEDFEINIPIDMEVAKILREL